MPRGVYDRSKARRRTTRASKASLSTRIEQLSKELASLSEEVKRAEGLQNAVNQYMQAAVASVAADGRRGPGRPPGTTGRRRGRPPGSKNRPKTETATGVRRGPGRPRKNAAAPAAPRRRGRPRKTETLG